ncbi:MAG TPA: IclR family transcriptional regulator [Steroidobacter sp.]|uniref:IclR family transcriptional regulator n=1 Tax=Steroidobacter sp. TaxID=1978227 RepID=UPI002EDAF0AE
MTGKVREQQGVQSIEVGGRLLECLAAAKGPMMLKELAQAADMPAPQAHRYLVSFMRMGLVEQHAETGLYDLGAFALQLGLSALGRIEPVTIATAYLADLSREIQQTVALAVWANHGATMVRWVSADTPVSATLRLGSVMPLTRSATGGVFLAYLSRSATSRLVRQELAENVRNQLTPTTAAEVDEWIERIRRRGYAYVADFIPGVEGASAPVFDHSGDVVLALTALGYNKPFQAKSQQIVAALKRTASTISQRLGYDKDRISA